METGTVEVSGSGSGSGYGSGSGSGYGYGYGSGYGSGSGSGYGDGDGDGYGYGSGSGYGDGDGDGYGYGSGYGDGYGDQKAAAAYFRALLKPYDTDGIVPAFYRSNLDGTPANGGKNTQASVGVVQTVEGPLALCTSRALHGTLNPDQWKGERWWVVSLAKPIAKEEDKLGSLKRVILADLGKCPF